MVKTLKNLLLQNQESFKAEYQVCSNDDRRLTSDLFTTRSNLHPDAFHGKNVEKTFSQNV